MREAMTISRFSSRCPSTCKSSIVSNRPRGKKITPTLFTPCDTFRTSARSMRSQTDPPMPSHRSIPKSWRHNYGKRLESRRSQLSKSVSLSLKPRVSPFRPQRRRRKKPKSLRTSWRRPVSMPKTSERQRRPPDGKPKVKAPWR